jgi:hypothetical protein
MLGALRDSDSSFTLDEEMNKLLGESLEILGTSEVVEVLDDLKKLKPTDSRVLLQIIYALGIARKKEHKALEKVIVEMKPTDPYHLWLIAEFLTDDTEFECIKKDLKSTRSAAARILAEVFPSFRSEIELLTKDIRDRPLSEEDLTQLLKVLGPKRFEYS